MNHRVIYSITQSSLTLLISVEVEILAHDRAGLLRDITSLLANEKINVLGVSTLTDKQLVAHMTFTLEILDIETLSRILAQLDQIPNVTGQGGRRINASHHSTLRGASDE